MKLFNLESGFYCVQVRCRSNKIIINSMAVEQYGYLLCKNCMKKIRKMVIINK